MNANTRRFVYNSLPKQIKRYYQHNCQCLVESIACLDDTPDGKVSCYEVKRNSGGDSCVFDVWHWLPTSPEYHSWELVEHNLPEEAEIQPEYGETV